VRYKTLRPLRLCVRIKISAISAISAGPLKIHNSAGQNNSAGYKNQ
jgi:hypothetical protein